MIIKEPVRFYFSFRSPFSGIALHRVMQCLDYQDVAFTLMPVWPDIIFGGHMDNPTNNLFKLIYIFSDAARQADVAGLNSEHLRGIAARLPLPDDVDYSAKKLGVSMGDEPWHIPHAAVHYAASQGRAWEFSHEVFMRRFNYDGKGAADVMDPDVVGQIARSVGLDGDQAAVAHESDDIRAKIDDVRRRGERDGVFGVPFCVLEREGSMEAFWGNDHLEYLLRAIRGTDQLPVLNMRSE